MMDDELLRVPLVSPADTAAAVVAPLPVEFPDRRSELAVYRLMANAPGALNAWLPLCDYFLETPGLEPRDREVLILRTGHRCGSAYEWLKHAPKAPEVGISPAELDALTHDEPLGLDRWTRSLVTFVDELHDHATVSDSTWTTVVERLGPSLAVTCLMLVGQYHLLAFTLNGAGVVAEPTPDPDPEDPA
ncbi:MULTISPECIES: carboxymuconolactone decarboxylase family protein [unclassified Aeromicrobium]|uniref:carboxymuconolactone decarboxylase family protein n=1 Tax=unclassified Aeromicrobium TaxID=2633570 RepID=UPI00396B119A